MRFFRNGSAPARAQTALYKSLKRRKSSTVTWCERKGILPLPGVAIWVRRLHEEGWLQAIASAAPRPNIEFVLEAFGAAGFFQGIVSAEDVHHGKPDPELFLIAASRVGVPTERCIAVEDASPKEPCRRSRLRRVM